MNCHSSKSDPTVPYFEWRLYLSQKSNLLIFVVFLECRKTKKDRLTLGTYSRFMSSMHYQLYNKGTVADLQYIRPWWKMISPWQLCPKFCRKFFPRIIFWISEKTQGNLVCGRTTILVYRVQLHSDTPSNKTSHTVKSLLLLNFDFSFDTLHIEEL